MSDPATEERRLLSELQDIDRSLRKGLLEETSRWSITVGRFEIRGIFSPNLITVIFVFFNFACFVVGVVFSLLGGTFNSLGISLVVGAVFAISAFMAQLWAVSYTRSKAVLDEIFGGDLEELKTLAARRSVVAEKIIALSQQPNAS